MHHIKPFHLYPQLELDPNNLITLCRSKYWRFDCHLAVGHGGSFRRENRYLLADISTLKVIAAPAYIRVNGIADRDRYLHMINQRTKKEYLKE